MTCPACAVPGCDSPHKARGWCSQHYQRWLRHGDPFTVRPGGRASEAIPPNPWAGRHPCPTCGSSAWTLPAEVYVPGTWRCCSCSVAWVPAAKEAAA